MLTRSPVTRYGQPGGSVGGHPEGCQADPRDAEGCLGGGDGARGETTATIYDISNSTYAPPPLHRTAITSVEQICQIGGRRFPSDG